MAGHQVAEVGATGVFNRGELYAGNRHLATYTAGANGSTFFTHSDWLGTERARTDMTASTCESIASLPFGDGQSISGTCGDVSPMHFTGKERDSESGLDNFGARFDSSSLGRFMSVDPSRLSVDPPNPQTWNRYTYANNNPLAYVDRNGKWSKWIHAEIIENAFGSILTANERQILKNESEWVDNTTQAPNESFKHGMRAPDEDPSQAVAETNAWVNENLQKAVEIQLGAESVGQTGNDPGALAYFGIALHAVTDSTSPWHRDANGNPLPWAGESGWNLPAAGWHGLRETVWGGISEFEAKYDAQVKAAFLWNQYQARLAAARKKQEEEEAEMRRKACQQSGNKDCV